MSRLTEWMDQLGPGWPWIWELRGHNDVRLLCSNNIGDLGGSVGSFLIPYAPMNAQLQWGGHPFKALSSTLGQASMWISPTCFITYPLSVCWGPTSKCRLVTLAKQPSLWDQVDLDLTFDFFGGVHRVLLSSPGWPWTHNPLCVSCYSIGILGTEHHHILA